jgi:2',3'-cyclic-nucleotide 2'-phosphodiesterase (5'-nucleotidase family)
LLIDAGDYVHANATQGERENWFILRTMGQMGYDAMMLGDLELNRGADYVKSIIDSTKVPITLANVHFADSKEPVGKRFIMREVNGVTCGIIGLVGTDFGSGKDSFKNLGFDIEDPFEVAGKLVPEVRKQVDMVIVLAHLGSADAFQLPKAVPGIDVVIFGHYPGVVAPTQVEGALTVRSGQRGQYLGETRIVVNPENKVVSYSGQAVELDVKKISENAAIAAELKVVKELIKKDKEANKTPGSATPGGGTTPNPGSDPGEAADPGKSGDAGMP